jgi:inner membrane protein involved in colicin E2 resistance
LGRSFLGEVAVCGTNCRVVYAALTINGDLKLQGSRDCSMRDEGRDAKDANLRSEWGITGFAGGKRPARQLDELLARRF